MLDKTRNEWQNLADLIFSDIMMMAGLEDLDELQKCRLVCQNWNMMITQMTRDKKHTIRRTAERMAAQIRENWSTLRHTPLFPEISRAASLAHHRMLGSVRVMRLQDVDLASVPAQHLASLASCASLLAVLHKVRKSQLSPILDNIKSDVLGLTIIEDTPDLLWLSSMRPRRMEISRWKSIKVGFRWFLGVLLGMLGATLILYWLYKELLFYIFF